jgi:hypothetical protein
MTRSVERHAVRVDITRIRSDGGRTGIIARQRDSRPRQREVASGAVEVASTTIAPAPGKAAPVATARSPREWRDEHDVTITIPRTQIQWLSEQPRAARTFREWIKEIAGAEARLPDD